LFAHIVEDAAAIIEPTHLLVHLVGAAFEEKARQLPMGSKVSSANPSGSMLMWHVAHAGMLRCLSSC